MMDTNAGMPSVNICLHTCMYRFIHNEDLNSFQIYLLFKKDPDPNGSTVEKYSCWVSRKGGPMELAQ